MSVDIVDTPRAARRGRGTHAQTATPSTSIRVSVATRDALAKEAELAGVSLARYLDKIARRGEKERIFAEFRASEIEAYKDPAYVAEILEWDEMDDGIEFDDYWSHLKELP